MKKVILSIAVAVVIFTGCSEDKSLAGPSAACVKATDDYNRAAKAVTDYSNQVQKAIPTASASTLQSMSNKLLQMSSDLQTKLNAKQKACGSY